MDEILRYTVHKEGNKMAGFSWVEEYGPDDRLLQSQSAYMLLGQHDWILRRSEEVSFSSSGSTERSISFDVMLPQREDLWLKWSAGGTKDKNKDDNNWYVGLPVTFLGKGDLINFDATDGEGNALHTVLNRDDQFIMDNALTFCLRSAQNSEQLWRTLNGIIAKAVYEQYTNLGNPTRGREKAYKTQLAALYSRLRLWCMLFDEANGSVISGERELPELRGYSGRKIGYDGKPIEQGNHADHSVKYLAFNLIHDLVLNDSWCGLLQNAEARKFERRSDFDPFRGVSPKTCSRMKKTKEGERSSEYIGYVNESPAPSEVIEQLERDRKALLEQLLHSWLNAQNRQKSNKGSRNGYPEEESKQKLNNLLQKCKDNGDWLLVAFCGFLIKWQEDVDASGDKEGKDALCSYLMLLSSACDTYPLIVLIPRDRAHDRLLIKISFDSTYKELHRWDPIKQTIGFAFQTYGARSTHIEVASLDDAILTDASQISHRKNSGEERSKMRARATSGRLHLATDVYKKEPITRLRLNLMLKQNYVVSFLLWSLLTVVFTGTVAMAMTPGTAQNWLLARGYTLLDTANILALLAVILTLWVARRISTIQHRLVEGVNSQVTGMMNIDLALMLISSLLVCRDGKDDTHVWHSTSIRGMLSWVCAGAAICIAIIAVITFVTYVRRPIKNDCTIVLPVHYEKQDSASKDDVQPKDALMAADKAAFSIVENFEPNARFRAMSALGATVHTIEKSERYRRKTQPATNDSE